MSAVDHIFLEEIEIGALQGRFGVAGSPALEKLALHKGGVSIAFCMNRGENYLGFFLPVITSKVTRRLGRKEQTNAEEDSRDRLKAPWDPEGGSTLHEGSPIADVEDHDHAPGQGPLLSSNDTTTLAGRSQFGHLDWHLC
jgi:hypothetical protein